jgi:hypothetical protein
MHSGIVNRNRSPGRGPLPQSIWLEPGLLTGPGKSLRCPGFCHNKPFGQAVAGSIAAVAPVQGVNFQLLVRGGRRARAAAAAAAGGWISADTCLPVLDI